MTAANKLQLVSVEDYLEGELNSPIKHEYLGGVVHAMSGERNLHNRIAGNIFARLHVRLQGKACQPWNSDTKVHIRQFSLTYRVFQLLQQLFTIDRIAVMHEDAVISYLVDMLTFDLDIVDRLVSTERLNAGNPQGATP